MTTTLSTLLVAAAGAQPAGGAATGEIVIATSAATVLTIALLTLGMGHRSGRVRVLDRLGALSERITGLPAWASFPASVATVSLLVAVFGMYWDISLHIDVGRDPGPLANPAHYFILFGLFGIFSAGFFAMVMPRERPSAGAIAITSDWHAPLGGVLICACGAFSLTGFPLDDVWHRLFGQDVTLWGPTHLMLIGGAAMTLIGIAVLVVEGRRASSEPLHWTIVVPLFGGLLIGLSTFQAEFDFGVPQFRFVFGPMLIMLAAGVGLVAARVFGGRGAALGAVAFFLLVRGVLAVLIGPILGESTPHFPLYVVEALVVEALALVVSTKRPLAFGLVAGLGIGTLGLAAEWGWTHAWSPIPWPAQLFPEGALFGLVAAVAGGLLGAWVGNRLAPEPAPGLPSLRCGALVGAAAVTALVAVALYKPAENGISARLALTPAGAGVVNATVQLSPPDAAKTAVWFDVTSWQGGGLRVAHMREIGPGRYRADAPVPVSGSWKSILRLHRGNSLMGVPVFLPEDRAIPANEVPATNGVTRTFVADHTILQREQKAAGGALTTLAYAVVAAIALSLLILLAWGLHRLSLGDRAGRTRPRGTATSGRPRDLAGSHA